MPRLRTGFPAAVLVGFLAALPPCLLATAVRAQAPAAPGRVTGTDAPDASSLVAQAIAYEHGEGVPKDPLKAAALYCEAARAGDGEALFDLGWMYANGRGIPRDNVIAATLFRRAAQGGHAQAQRVLPLFHEDGEAIPDCLKPVVADISLDLNAGWGTGLDIEPDPFLGLTPQKQKIADLIMKIAPRYAVDPRLAMAVVAVESNFRTDARSPKDARGLMQLIPETAARFNVKKPFDATESLRGGLQYLRWLLAYYQGSVPLAIAAYNAGEGAVDRYRGVPPYPETRDYVKRVMSMFKRVQHPYDSRIVDRSPAFPESRAK